jgi:hypothetical protein
VRPRRRGHRSRGEVGCVSVCEGERWQIAMDETTAMRRTPVSPARSLI